MDERGDSAWSVWLYYKRAPMNARQRASSHRLQVGRMFMCGECLLHFIRCILRLLVLFMPFNAPLQCALWGLLDSGCMHANVTAINQWVAVEEKNFGNSC